MSLLQYLDGVQQKFLRPSGSCSTCPRRRVDFVPATLEKGKVLWLGEAPGETEVKEQEGFTGKTGQLMRRIAEEVGVPQPWSFSNTIHCRPPKNATPKPKEIACCLSQFVLDEIRGYPIVVLCGTVPVQALFPKASASHFRGNVALHPDFPGQRFYATWHPSYVARNDWVLPEYRQQLGRLARLAQGQAEPDWTLVRGKQAPDALKECLTSRILSVDVEVNKLETWEVDARITSFAVSPDGKRAVAIDEDDQFFVAMLDLLREYVENPRNSIVGANLGFDVECIAKETGAELRCMTVHDVLIEWYEARQYKHPSLKELVPKELDGYRYLVHHEHLDYDPSQRALYNGEDAIHTFRLWKQAQQELNPRQWDLVARVLSPAGVLFREMGTTGLYLRHAYRQQKIDEYQEKRRVAVMAWKDEDPEFVPDTYESGKGLRKYLFEIRQLPVVGHTPKGEPSTDKAALKQWVRDGHTYLQHLLTIREIDKLLSTYLMAYDDHVWPDSRIRSSFWLTSTDTSRPSSTDPNLFNIPRNREIRDLFGVPPGWEMSESDLSQIEFRMMVCLAQDENGIQGYLRGEDAHTMTARTFAGGEPTKEQRSNAKPVNFSLLYGGDEYGVQRMARDDYGLDWSLDVAKGFTDGFFRTYPRIPIFHRYSREKLVANKGWFESVTGHRYFYRDWNNEEQSRRDHAFRSALNSEAQGPAANLCLYIAVLARRLLNERKMREVKMVNSVYDSIMVQYPDPKLRGPVHEALNDATRMAYEWVRHWFVVPLVIEHGVGESWGSLEEAGKFST